MGKKNKQTAPEEIKPVEETKTENKTEIKETVLDLGFSETPVETAQEPQPEIKPERIKRTGRTKAEMQSQKPAEPATTWGENPNEQEQETAQEQIIEPQGTTLASMFPSGGLVTVLDKLMSVLMPLSINAIAGTKLNKKDFALDASEKKAISPALDEAAKTIPINFNNPWVNLSIVLGGVYLGKTLQVVNMDNIGQPEKRKRRTKEEIEAEKNN